MANEIAQVRSEVEALAQSLEALGIIQQQHSNKLGLAEKGILKFKVALKQNPISRVTNQMLEMAKGVGQVTKFVANNSVMSKKEREESYKKMTILQKLTTSYLLFGGVASMNNKILQVANNRFTRLMTRVFSLVSIFLIVGFALAALSIAFDGTNSDVLDMTEKMGPMHDAMQGLALIISGEGDEGLAALFDILAVSILGAAAAMAVFNGRAGLLVGAALAIVGTYQLVKNETGSNTMAFLGAASAALGLTAGLYLLRAAFIYLATGTMASATLLVAQILGGLALVLGGFVGLYMYATGAGEGFKGFLLGLLSVIAIAVGAALIGAMSIPLAIGLALGLLVATIVRYWDEVKIIGATIWGWIKGFAGMIWFGLLAGLGMIVGAVTGILAGIIGIVLGIVNGLWTALVSVVTGFWTALISGGDALKEWFLSIPTTIKDGFISGFKEAFNAVLTIYNDFAGKMEFDIPDWVPKIGGDSFSLPKVPMLAKGGIVTGPTLAVLGDNPSGKEAVVPLEKAGEMGFGGGGGITVNINVGGVTDRTDKKQLAREIGDLIRAEMSRGGRSYGNRRSAV
jgi:hypothetical protein